MPSPARIAFFLLFTAGLAFFALRLRRHWARQRGPKRAASFEPICDPAAGVLPSDSSCKHLEPKSSSVKSVARQGAGEADQPASLVPAPVIDGSGGNAATIGDPDTTAAVSESGVARVAHTAVADVAQIALKESIDDDLHSSVDLAEAESGRVTTDDTFASGERDPAVPDEPTGIVDDSLVASLPPAVPSATREANPSTEDASGIGSPDSFDKQADMRITKRSSGGRGEYEISEEFGETSPRELAGRRIVLDLGHSLQIDTGVLLLDRHGKRRLRMDRNLGCEMHLHRQLAAVLLMPHPARDEDTWAR